MVMEARCWMCEKVTEGVVEGHHLKCTVCGESMGDLCDICGKTMEPGSSEPTMDLVIDEATMEKWEEIESILDVDDDLGEMRDHLEYRALYVYHKSCFTNRFITAGGHDAGFTLPTFSPPSVTPEMAKHFVDRTKKHIALVQKYAYLVCDALEFDPALGGTGPCEFLLDGLLDCVEKHDADKFFDPLVIPYVHISWQYRLIEEAKKRSNPDNMTVNTTFALEEQMTAATFKHVTSNEHHPEFWNPCANCQGTGRDFPEAFPCPVCKGTGEATQRINREDRDKTPAKIVDATRMPPLAIAEMVCDAAAMSEELGTSLKGWFDKQIGTRWAFSEEQKALIYKIVEVCEKAKEVK